MVTLVLAISLGICGLAVVLVAAVLIFTPLLRPARSAAERAAFRRCLARRDRGDARLAANDVAGAIREFGGAFCLILPRADPALVVDIARLHTGLLSRFVAVGGDLPGSRVQLFALAKVERLLEQWTDIQRRVVRQAPSVQQAVRLRRQRRETARAVQELVRDLIERARPPLPH